MKYPDALRYRALRHYGDARDNTFDDTCDDHVDGWLDWLKEHDYAAFVALHHKPGAPSKPVMPEPKHVYAGPGHTPTEVQAHHEAWSLYCASLEATIDKLHAQLAETVHSWGEKCDEQRRTRSSA